MKVTFYLTYSCPLHFGSETCVNSFETIQNEQMKRGTITIPKAHFHNNTLDIVKKKHINDVKERLFGCIAFVSLW